MKRIDGTTDDYNGWRNYETWNVKLWLDNDWGTAQEAQEIAARGDSSRYEARLALREYVEQIVLGDEATPASLATDLLGAALSQVDWDEIVAAYRED